MSRLHSKQPKSFSPWYGLLILAMLGVAFGLKIVDGFRANLVSNGSDVPSVSYEDVVKEPELEPVVEPIPSDTSPAEVEIEPQVREPKALDAEMNLAVPFTSQAPTGNWDPLHQDACEEASFFMVHQFYAGTPDGKIDPAVADPELQRLVHVGESLGQGPSITLAEAKDLLMKDSNTQAFILENPTVGDIKLLISEGKPVIVPALGRELGNPNFTGAGPLYHMLVIRGYTETTFITNDPGTRLGENYVYDIDVLMAAIADWNGGDPVNGAARVLYFDLQ